MENFRYLAINEKGQVTRGNLVAHNQRALDAYLRRIGLTMIECRQIKESLLTRLFAGQRVQPRILGLFYSRVAEALAVNLPIITVLEENAMALGSPPLRRTILEIKAHLEEGLPLAEAMQKFPGVFSELEISMAALGEQTGTLPQCLKDLAEFIEWRENLKSTIMTASIYPAFVLICLGFVIAVWIGKVLPNMAQMLIDMGVQLPIMTRILLVLSRLLQEYWLVALLLIGAVMLWTYLIIKTPRGRIAWDRSLLQLPLVGKVVHQIALTRLTKNFAVMMKGGLAVNRIFDILIAGVLGNRYLEGQLQLVQEYLQTGLRLSESFERVGGFPILLIGEIRNGETTGTLEQSFERVTRFFDNETNRAVKGMLAAFGPTVVVILGVIFGVVILSILLPLYDVIGGVNIG